MSLRTLNLSASILHFTLAIAFGIYFANMNNTNPNQPVQGVELSMRDHKLTIETVTGNCIPNDTTICDASGNGFHVSWSSSLTVWNRLLLLLLLLLSIIFWKFTFQIIFIFIVIL
jgi:hypothetical protein